MCVFCIISLLLALIWIIDHSRREEMGLHGSKSVLGLDGVAWLTLQFKLQTWTVLNDSRRAKKKPQTTKMLSCGNEFEGVSQIRGVSKASFSAFSHLIASIVSQSGLWLFFKSTQQIINTFTVLNVWLSDSNPSDGWVIFLLNDFAHHFHGFCRTEAKY